jgi:hypothetical protein
VRRVQQVLDEQPPRRPEGDSRVTLALVSAYTIVNLREVEDSAEKFGPAPDVEARFGRRPLGAERAGLSFQRLAPNVRQPFGHHHGQQEEI